VTPDEMRAWRERMKLDRKNAAHRLGASVMALSRWETGAARINTRTALACAALAAGLEPYRERTELVGGAG
jgi:DNA-binding transcriptional regulator YiaG